MAVKGVKSSGGENNFSPKVGTFKAQVVAWNPDSEKLQEITGMPEELAEKLTNYSRENGDGEAQSLITVHLRTEEGVNLSHTFFLVDKDQVSKAGAIQKINSVGMSSYPRKGTTEYSSFLTEHGRTLRNAKVGEAQLYDFLKAWIQIDTRREDAELQFDFKKLMKGNVKELNSLIGDELTGSVMGSATVRTVDQADGSQKTYQGVWKEFLSEYHYDVYKKSGENKHASKSLTNYFDSLTGEHGTKDAYSTGMLEDYTPEERASKPKTAVIDEEEDY